MSQHRAKKNKDDAFTELKIQGILERGKKLVEKINSNLYQDYNYEDKYNYQSNSPNKYDNFDNKKELDMLDRAELLEYSTELHNDKTKKNELSFSNLNESISNHADTDKGNINIREYENIVMKIDNILITEDKALKILKENLIYLECKVPLFKAERKNSPEVNNIFYDTFKIYNKTNSADNNTFKLDHVSYHKIKLGEDNFSALTTSKIEFYLHCINLRKNNEDKILGNGFIDFNRLFLAKDFFLNLNLEITNYIEPKEEEEVKDNKNTGKNPAKKNITKKPIGRQNQQNKQSENKKIIQEIPYKIGELKISCQLYRNANASLTEQNNKENFFNNNNNYAEINQLNNKSKIISNDFFPEDNTYSNIPQDQANKNVSTNNLNSHTSNIHHQQGENSNLKNMHNFDELNYNELKLDFEDILVLYVRVSHLVPFTNENQNNQSSYNNTRGGTSMHNNYYTNSQNTHLNIPNYNIRNFFLSHKIFPKTEISTSEVFWHSLAPRFDYELSMPFVVNQQTAEMLDKGAFVLELWHKSNNEDELLGTTKLDLFPIIDSLRINEDTLSIIPISRNLQPLIIYDGNYPVFNYDSLSNIYFLDITMAVGTAAQINNYIKKSKANQSKLLLQQSQYNSVYSGDYGSKRMMNNNTNKNFNNNLNITNNETMKYPGTFLDYNNNNYYNSNYPQQPPNFGTANEELLNNNKLNKNQNNNPNQINDDEIFEINSLMNNNNLNKNNNNNPSSDVGGISNTNFAKFDVEKFLENNRLEFENINFKEGMNNEYNNANINKHSKDYSNPFAKNEKKHNQYENPFIVNTNTNANNNTNLNLSELPANVKYDQNNKMYQISKESNFYIDNKDKDNALNKENIYKLNKLSDTEFFKSGKNLLKSIENNDINPEFDNYQFRINDNDMSKINNDNKSSHNNKEMNFNNHLVTESKGDTQNENPFGNNKNDKNLIPRFNNGISGNNINALNNNYINNIDNFSNFDNEKINQINNKNNRDSINSGPSSSNLVRHIFEILIEKLINLQVLHKLTKFRPYLKYKFFNDSEYVKSDILYYSEYDKETSSIQVDMKTSHSNVIKTGDKIRELIGDLQILFIYQNNEATKEESDSNEVIFGKANLPVEELQELILNLNSNNTSNKKSTIFIYGTEKINREDCIIGKLKLCLNYQKQNVLQDNENDNILYEKQIVYSRKIPKNSCLIMKLNYFKYNENFLKNYECYQQEKNNFFYFEIDIFHDDKSLRNVFRPKRTSKKFKSLNGLFEEEFLFEMEMNSAILDYLKNKKALINLIVSRNNTNFIDIQNNLENNDKITSSNIHKSKIFEANNFDSDDEDFNLEKEILGTCKFSFNEILIDPDFSNKVYDIISNNNSNLNLGFINFDIKLENSATVEGRLGSLNKEKLNNKENANKNKEEILNNIDHLKAIMKTKKDKRLDGKFYLLINIFNLVYDENFIDKIIENYKNNNLSNKNKATLLKGKNTQFASLEKFTSKPAFLKNYNPDIEFYLTFKLGKNIKRITPSSNFSESDRVFKESFLMIKDISYTEILELNLQFSKNKPEDIIRAFTDNLFEFKLYLKSEDDNDINVGSFILDISKLLANESKINDKIYFSKNANVNLYENSNMLFDGVKLASSFSLIKSEYEKTEFIEFYESIQNVFMNNFSVIQKNLFENQFLNERSENEINASDGDNEKHKSPNYFSDDSAKNEVFNGKKNNLNNLRLKQKRFKKLIRRFLGKDLYEYIDLHLISLEDKSGNLIYKNIKELANLFSNGISFTNQLCNKENLNLIENIKIFSKLKLRKKLMSERNKYIFDIFELSKIFKIKIPSNSQEDYSNLLNAKKSTGDLKYISKLSNFNKVSKKIKMPAEDVMLFLKNFKNYLNETLTNNFFITENPAAEKSNAELIDLLDFIIEIHRLDKMHNKQLKFLDENQLENENNNQDNLENEDLSSSELNNNNNFNNEKLQNLNRDNNEKNKNFKNEFDGVENQEYSFYTIKITVISGLNLIILDKPLSFKPNGYFVFNWGSEETYISNAILQVSNPEWQQEIDIKIPIKKNSFSLEDRNNLLEKLAKNVSITVFSKNISNEEMDKFNQNNFNANFISNNISSQELITGKNIINPFATINNLNPNMMNRDEFIGETNISLIDIINNLTEYFNYNDKSLNNNLIHDAFYHIYNRKENIVGQIRVSFSFEENLIFAVKDILNNNYSLNINKTTNNLNIYSSNVLNNSSKYYPNKGNSAIDGIELIKKGIIEKTTNSNIKINDNLDINFRTTFDTDKNLKGENKTNLMKNSLIDTKKDYKKIHNLHSLSDNYLNNQVNNQNLEELDNDILWKKIRDNENYLQRIQEEESLRKFSGTEISPNKNCKSNPMKKEENVIPEYSSLIVAQPKKQEEDNLFNKSLQMNFDEEIKEKNYDFHSLIEKLDKEHEKIDYEINEKVNHSVIEKPKLNLKKPPVPEFNNLYKKADKNFLKKIQNILKKNESKSFNYLSSDEEN